MNKWIVWCCILLAACKPESPAPPQGSLAAYLAAHARLGRSQQLIACAAGGQAQFLADTAFPVSVFFLPVEGATDFRYFEAAADAPRDELSRYQEQSLPLEPLFNGYLMRFLHPGAGEERWGRVTYIAGDSVHICNAIRLKLPQKPSEFAPELVSISFPAPTQPRFEWQDGRIKENEIYFQVVSDQAGNLISGTYTYEPYFQFYDLSNVVLNIRDVQPPPTLSPNTPYVFTLMGVSIDNWVNLIAEKSFRTD
ncbi:MAG: hypothetical protein D6730_13925 [Bacteroidetes bacterium]|nr:MAG: hypothetical protein D6730_13925 [Bacteroidota bacterium]